MSLHPARLPIEALLAECQVERTRRGGPGGQHRNKVETAVVIVHRPSGSRGEASERRSQQQNHSEAVFRLRVNLALEVRQPAADSPSGLWQGRTSGGRLSVNASHDDFPAMLAEALDRVAAEEFDLAASAQKLGITGSQLVKFLKIEPRALAKVNHARESQGLAKLR
jgi:hypothetical protein